MLSHSELVLFEITECLILALHHTAQRTLVYFFTFETKKDGFEEPLDIFRGSL